MGEKKLALFSSNSTLRTMNFVYLVSQLRRRL